MTEIHVFVLTPAVECYNCNGSQCDLLLTDIRIINTVYLRRFLSKVLGYDLEYKHKNNHNNESSQLKHFLAVQQNSGLGVCFFLFCFLNYTLWNEQWCCTDHFHFFSQKPQVSILSQN